MSDRIDRELSLPASPQEVWDAITGDGWLADEVELELHIGGDARFSSGASVKTGWVEDVAAPERLVFWWATDGEPATRVELTLEPATGELTLEHATGERTLEPATGERTRLRVVETRPLDALDLVGTPLRRIGGRSYGPALVAA